MKNHIDARLRKWHFISALCLLLVTCSNQAQSQNYLGIRNSNYAGILGATLNPSSMIESKLTWDINLLSVTADGDNNFLYIPKDSLRFMGIGNFIDQVKNKHYYTRFDPDDPNKTYDFTLSAEAMGPSLMFRFAKRHALGFTTATRFYLVANDAPGHQSQQAYFENRDTSLYSVFRPDDDTKLNVMGWFEYGVNYAYKFYQKKGREISGGINLKYMDGVGAGYIKNVSGDYNLADDHDLYFQNAAADYGRTNYNTFEDIDSYRDLIHGNGFGGGIGFTYTVKKDSSDYTYVMDCKNQVDPNKSPYKFKLGVSLTDIGKINFDRGAEYFHIEADSTLWHNYRANYFNSNFDFDHSLSSVFYQGDSMASQEGTGFSMSLPTALNIQFDYNLYKSFYLNATIIKGFRAGSGQGVTHPDIYSVTPRYETKWFEVSAPISLISYHHLTPRFGLCVRAGYFFIGGDALGGAFALSDFEGMDLYAGLHIFFPHHKLHDDDGDLVSNKKDSCLTEKGNCLTHGCPDRDGDGIIDKLDRCPDTAGPAYLNGCPDRDNDSIPDIDDECPDIPGPRESHGCPDTDGDGISDPHDSCKLVKGLAQFHGCPDTDGDGIPDSRDSCPTVKGLPELDGCPDRDGDGVADYKDRCPDIPGSKLNYGCPDCPTASDIANIKLASQSILFQTSKAIIDPTIYQVIDRIAEIMNRCPNLKWSIEGYTDNTGSDKINQPLSEARADAVRDYLLRKGVDPEKVSAIGFGSKDPIATNATEAGRSKNRRVEIKIVQ